MLRHAFTAVQVPKIFSRVLVPLANNPTLGVQHAVAPGYENILQTVLAALFTVRNFFSKSRNLTVKKQQQNDVDAFSNFAYRPRTCTAVEVT